MVKGIRAVVTAAALKVCRLIRRDDNAKLAGRAAGIGTPESAISPCVASRVYGISCEVVFGTWNHILTGLLGLGDGSRQRHCEYRTQLAKGPLLAIFLCRWQEKSMLRNPEVPIGNVGDGRSTATKLI